MRASCFSSSAHDAQPRPFHALATQLVPSKMQRSVARLSGPTSGQWHAGLPCARFPPSAEVLGVSRSASQADIKRAYYQSMGLHPSIPLRSWLRVCMRACIPPGSPARRAPHSAPRQVACAVCRAGTLRVGWRVSCRMLRRAPHVGGAVPPYTMPHPPCTVR